MVTALSLSPNWGTTQPNSHFAWMVMTIKGFSTNFIDFLQKVLKGFSKREELHFCL